MEKTIYLPPKGFSKAGCKEKLRKYRKQLFELQNLVYADGSHALLLIFQGADTSGKDGTIRHVMSCMNPAGVRVTSFKKPTEEEIKHDFLWRIYPHFPEKGVIQVFNRSYYEDILVPGVNKSLPHKILDHRYALINELEKHLTFNAIHILKFYLSISREEQKKRIEARKIKPNKRWKYDSADEKANREWDRYRKAYEVLFERCSVVPWQLIPSDKRWYRNYSVARILTEYLESLKLSYPSP